MAKQDGGSFSRWDTRYVDKLSLTSSLFRSAWEKRTWGQALGGMVKKASKSVITSVLGAEDFDNVSFAVSEESVKRTAAKMLEAVQNHGEFERWPGYRHR